MKNKFDILKIENQLCFPLYACAKEVVRKYKPYLDKIDLTYTQYLAMLVMWEHIEITVKDIGQILYLDSGTLTPVLKKLEQKGYVERHRAKEDERNLNICLTEKGKHLKDTAVNIPKQMGKCLALNEDEIKILYKILYKILEKIEIS